MELTSDGLNQALSAIRRMANDYKAFKNAEEVLETFVAAHAQVGERSKKLAALTAEIDTIMERRAKAEQDHLERLAAMGEELEEAKKGAAQDWAVIDGKRRVAAAQVADIESKTTTAEATLEAVEKKIAEAVASMQPAIDAKNEELAVIQAHIDQLKSKFA